MKFHEIAECFPLLEDELLEELAKDIEENGQIRPIVVFEDQILDGRNRFLACQKAKVEPKTTKFIGDWGQALKFVTSENLHRRHLTESQRGWAASKLLNLKPGRPEKTGSIDPVSAAKAAELMNVSEKTVKRASQIQKKGAPELVAAVEKGDVKITAGAELTKLTEAEQRQIVQAGPQAVKKAAADLRKQPAGERVLERRGPVSYAQEATRRARQAGKLIADLHLMVKAIENAVELASTMTLDEMQEAVARKAITRLDAGLGFLKSAINGEKLSADQALAKWLSEGRR